MAEPTTQPGSRKTVALFWLPASKYSYITCRYLPPFFEHKHRIVYSKVDNVNQIEDIQHPVVRVALELSEIKEGMEIHHAGDLPARAGLGSSSAFSVGMLNALHALKGKMISKKSLKDLLCIPFNFEGEGSQIILFQPDSNPRHT